MTVVQRDAVRRRLVAGRLGADVADALTDRRRFRLPEERRPIEQGRVELEVKLHRNRGVREAGSFRRPHIFPVACADCASTTANAVMFMMPRDVVSGVRMWAGSAAPMRIGPTGRASAMTLVSS